MRRAAMRSPYDDVNAADAQARRQAAVTRENYLAPRDAQFERGINLYANKFLNSGDGSAPRRILDSALQQPLFRAGHAIPASLSEIGRVAILRAIRDANGTGLSGADALQHNEADLGVTAAQVRSQGVAPAVLNARLNALKQQAEQLDFLRRNKALYDPGSDLERRQARKALTYDDAGNAYLNGRPVPKLSPDEYRQAVETPNAIDTYGAALASRLLRHITPAAGDTDPALFRALDSIPISASARLKPDARSWADFFVRGTAQTAAETPGLSGALNSVALSLASPTNLLITGATGGLGAVARAPRLAATLQMWEQARGP